MKLDLHKSANMTAVKVPSKFITITLVALDDRMKAVLYFLLKSITILLRSCYIHITNLL